METPKKSGRVLKLVLVLSLGVNLAIGGLAIGVWGFDKPRRPPSPDAVAFLSFALPAEHRNALRQQLVSRRAELRTNRAAIKEMRGRMVEALQAEPFDIAVIERILQQQREHFLALGELAHSALLERIELLTPEDRATYVQALLKQPRRAQWP